MTPLTAIPLESFGSDYQTPDPKLEALVALHTRTLDSLAGFETMVEKAEPAFRPVAESFRALHASQAATLSSMLTAMGHDVAHDGSFMGTINKTVVSIRALFDDIDADVMTSIRKGEDHVLTAFDDVLRQPFDAEQFAAISTMRDELVALLARSPASV